MTHEEATDKRCPFLKKNAHNDNNDVACKGKGCMAWSYQNRNANGQIIPDSGYCKRLT